VVIPLVEATGDSQQEMVGLRSALAPYTECVTSVLDDGDPKAVASGRVSGRSPTCGSPGRNLKRLV
jgi:hypothetical protein